MWQSSTYKLWRDLPRQLLIIFRCVAVRFIYYNGGKNLALPPNMYLQTP